MFSEEALTKELKFKAVRSSGSGGQHVNKVATKIELEFDLDNSRVLNEAQKARLKLVLNSKLTKNSFLLLQCGETRSQHRNKDIVIKRFLDLIRTSLIIKKKRKPSRITKSVKLKRLKAKQTQSEKKANRKKPDLD